MTNKYVIVLGGKPKSKIPKIQVNHIYSANGSAERIIKYIKFFKVKKKIAVTGAMEFNKKISVRERIINSRPDIIFCRSGYLQQKYLDRLPKKSNIINKSRIEQIFFQSKFYKYGILSIIYAEFFYEKKLFDKIKHIIKIINQKGMTGVSTGFFSILLAAYEHPNKKIICSGIGMKTQGKPFYSKIFRDNRKHVDHILFRHLDKKVIDKLTTTDQEMSDFCKIPLWKKKLI